MNNKEVWHIFSPTDDYIERFFTSLNPSLSRIEFFKHISCYRSFAGEYENNQEHNLLTFAKKIRSPKIESFGSIILPKNWDSLLKYNLKGEALFEIANDNRKRRGVIFRNSMDSDAKEYRWLKEGNIYNFFVC